MKRLTLFWVTLGIVTLLWVTPDASANNEIASVIREISPHVGQKTALNYAIIIDKYSKKYEVSWQVVVAIIRQESDFIHGEINKDYRDFGISQFNWKTIRSREVDLGLLLTDEDYAIHETFKLLAELKKKYYTRAKGHWQWFTRFHSYTPLRRKIYWYGNKISGHNGLRYKFKLIERSLKRVRANRSTRSKFFIHRGEKRTQKAM